MVIIAAMKPQSDPRIDFAFKHVFGREQNKSLLISLLDAVLQPAVGEGIASLEIMNPFNDKEELDDYHLIFELRERRHQALFTDQMAVHILELPKFTKTVGQLATPLDRWLYFLRHARDLDVDALPGSLDVPEVRSALGDLIMISQSKRDRERYESRQKMQRDVYTALAEAEEIGEARGVEKGLRQGIELGREEGQAEGRRALIESFQKLLRREALSREQLQRLSLPELENLAARLQTELNARLAGDA